MPAGGTMPIEKGMDAMIARHKHRAGRAGNRSDGAIAHPPTGPANPARLTTKQAVRVLEWAQRVLKLQDWALILQFDDSPPAWVGNPAPDQSGAADITVETKTANIWVSPSRAATNAVDTLIHEALEVWWEDIGLPDTNRHARSHQGIYILSAALAAAYAREIQTCRHD